MSLGKIQNVFESLSGAQGLSLQFQRKQRYQRDIRPNYRRIILVYKIMMDQ